MFISRTIHTVWTNSQQQSKIFHHHLQRWQQANPDHQIIVWTLQPMPLVVVQKYGYITVDNHTIRDLVHKASDKLTNKHKPIIYAGVRQLFIDARIRYPERRILLEQIEAYVDYQKDRLRPNFLAASHLIRLLAIAVYGGVYCDQSIWPGMRPLSSFKDFADHKLRFEGCRQGRSLLGNRLISCGSNYDKTWELLSFILDRLQNPELVLQRQKLSQLDYDRDEKMRTLLTESMSGALAINDFLSAQKAKTTLDTAMLTTVYNYSLPRTIYQLKKETTNRLNNFSVIAMHSKEYAIQLALTEMIYEFHFFKLIRIKPHILEIQRSLSTGIGLEVDSEELENIMITQLASMGDLTQAICTYEDKALLQMLLKNQASVAMDPLPIVSSTPSEDTALPISKESSSLQHEPMANWLSKIRKRSDITGHELLEDDQIIALLRNHPSLMHRADHHLLPAIDITRYAHVLAEIIQDYYEASGREQPLSKYTIIPINFDNTHWATLVIEQNELNDAAPKVYFFDSTGGKKINFIKQMLAAVSIYTAPRIYELSPKMALQHDGYSCGTWVIHAASAIVNARREGKPLTQFADLREPLVAELKIEVSKGFSNQAIASAVQVQHRHHLYRCFEYASQWQLLKPRHEISTLDEWTPKSRQ